MKRGIQKPEAPWIAARLWRELVKECIIANALTESQTAVDSSAANVNSGFAENDSLSRAPGSSPKFRCATKCDFLMPAEHQS